MSKEMSLVMTLGLLNGSSSNFELISTIQETSRNWIHILSILIFNWIDVVFNLMVVLLRA